MRHALWTDDTGRHRRSLIKDTDPDNMARYGIPSDPPNIRGIDMDAVFNEIEALQYEKGLWDWRAANQDQSGMQALINVFKRHLLEIYRNT
jgi:hypothetical protein